MKFSIENKLAIGFVLSLGLMLVFIISTYKDIARLIDLNYQGDNTQRTIKSIHETRIAILKMESLSRAHIPESDTIFFKKYHRAITDVKIKWGILNELLKKDSFFQTKKELLEKLISECIDISNTGANNILTTPINNELLRLEIYENHSLREMMFVKINTAKRTIIFLAILFPITLIIYIFVYILLKRDIAWRRESRKRIKAINDNLEKKVEERSIALSSSEKQYRLLAEQMTAILNNSPDAIWSIDTEKNLTSFNNSFCESMEEYYKISPYIGMPILNHLDSKLLEEWDSSYKRALRGEKFIQEMKRTHDDQELFFNISFNPIKVNDKVTGIAVFANNITTRKNLDEQLHYKVKELNTFMYKSTHDLRSPLVSVMGLIELAKSATKDVELIQYFNMIDESVHKMDQLLIDLVKIVNVSQGKLSTDEINFNTIIDEIVASLGYRTEFSEVVFKRHISEDFVFKTDRRLLYSIMQNLIDNALKYRSLRKGIESVIIINVSTHEHLARIGITDNGMGIPEKIQDKVFDMFYRGTTEAQGTGLGLYIVKTTVEKLGGKISLNSLPDKGTCFNISIPSLK
jgi:PAS domain S-box-containing protein